MEAKKVTIIRLGLIGGSLARALREKADISELFAVDTDEESLRQAMSEKIITRGGSRIDEEMLSADILFLCTPVRTSVGYLTAMDGRIGPGSLVTDTGSTKSEIMRCVGRMRHPPSFIGGHPMAGTEKSGYASGFSHLFENAYYVLTPASTATESQIAMLSELVGKIGGIPVLLDAGEHDRITGCISHLPHIIAAALVHMAREAEGENGLMKMLAAGGFRDITRIASSNPEMWENIILSNRDPVGDLLESYSEILSRFKTLMASEDIDGIRRFFRVAGEYRDSLNAGRKSLIEPSYDIIADVPDKPGIIGHIATLLGENGINIKNIRVSNSREYEQGCLVITLSGPDSVESAFRLLSDKGYKIYRHK